MKEYKVLIEPAITIQKLLNQWRHEYELDLLFTSQANTPGELIVVLTREHMRKDGYKKEEEE